MYNWFECKVKYEKMQGSGVQKTVTEPYLVDALSFQKQKAELSKRLNRIFRENFPLPI